MIEWLLAFFLGTWLGGASPGPAAEATPAIRAVAGAATAPSQAGSGDLDRIAFAVEGAESSHGRNPLMWSPNLRGPQGPMQVSHEAAVDVGGGNRFDLLENRLVGRAYLAGMFRRYGNWADAVAAYNWGPGNLDRWIAAGRPVGQLSAPIHNYIERIMREFIGVRAIGTALPAATSPPPVARPISARSVFPPVLPVPDPAPPQDHALRQRFERNAIAMKQLRDFIDGDDAAGEAARATIRAVSSRRGYEEFRGLRPANATAPSLAAVRDIARVLTGKLQSENAAIALVDERRHNKFH